MNRVKSMLCAAAVLFLLLGCTYQTAEPSRPAPSLVVIDTSATATSSVTAVLLSFKNAEYGFSFTYPGDWKITERRASEFRNPAVILEKPDAQLVIEYGLLHRIQALQTGQRPAGEDRSLSPVDFFDQQLPVIAYLSGGRAVWVAMPEPNRVFQVGDMFFNITLRPPSNAVTAGVDFPDILLDEVLGIVESFSAVERTAEIPDPFPGWKTYLSTDYGLLLRYPSEWVLADTNWETLPGLYEKAISLKRGNIELLIGYHFAQEYIPHEENFVGGLLWDEGTVPILGQDVAKLVLRYEDRDKAVFYHGLEGLESGSLVFTIRLHDTTMGAGYDLITVSDQDQAEAESILASLQQFTPAISLPAQTVISSGSLYFLPFDTCFDLDEGTQKPVDDLTCDLLMKRVTTNSQKAALQPLNRAAFNFSDTFDTQPDADDCAALNAISTVKKTELALDETYYCYQTGTGRYGALILRGMTRDGASFDWSTGSRAGPLAVSSMAGSGLYDQGAMIKDMTIPDGTVLKPGETFTKTWQLLNKGTSTWTTAYAIRFESGDRMGAAYEIVIPSEVPPNGAVNVSVEMTAPLEPGQYTGNWVLRNASGNRFGVGEDSGEPFWVTIVVEE